MRNTFVYVHLVSTLHDKYMALWPRVILELLKVDPDVFQYSTDIYFYVDITHDMNYMFSTVFTSSHERPIVFDMSPRDVEWSTKHFVVMDELGRCWYEHWSRKN